MDLKGQVIQLVIDYRMKSIQALSILKINKPRFNNYLKTEHRRGILKAQDGDIRFEFHGKGCWFKFSNGALIDIDFAEGRIDQIDKYFLGKYWDSTSHSYPMIRSFEELEGTLNVLVSEKILSRQGNKYYLEHGNEFVKDFNLF